MQTYIVIRRDYWPSGDALEQAAERTTEVAKQMADSVKWIHTYPLAEASGRLGTLCIYQATSEEAVREHADCAELPIDEVIRVADAAMINRGKTNAP